VARTLHQSIPSRFSVSKRRDICDEQQTVYVLSAILMLAGSTLQAISANERTAGEVVDDMSIAAGQDGVGW
jgi:hypothetical protein